MSALSGCADHGQPSHVCNHAPSSVSESLDEIEFSRSIHAACIANNEERVRFILSKGTSRGGESPACALDSAGYTALVKPVADEIERMHYASRSGNKEICTLLLNAGADVDAKTRELGTTPLMRSVQQNHLDVSRLLVSYGASLDERNADQENIFHVLACAARGRYNQGSRDAEDFLGLAQWLKTKANTQGKLDSMLCAQDIRQQRPMDHVPEDSPLKLLLTV
ncbi:Ankyrin repeat domain-containing protein 39 [Mortierella sp. GBA30]|nr:Ankyrin repeat domain-containing protein 39 [Mortierella sp. GBA30]